MLRRYLGLLLCGGAVACPADDAGSNTGTETEGADTTGSGGDLDGAAGGDVLGCAPGMTCTLVLVSQTLDDRIEIFAPGDANPYRGAIDLDLKPNVCDGCELGDYADGRLDEPFGLARAGGFMHVALGHYPTRQSGSLVSFPLTMFDDLAAGSTLAVSDYFAAGSFLGPVVAHSLDELEPIFVTARGSRLLVGTFNNDLFTTEDNWTMPGRLLVLDATDPGAAPGVVDLGAMGCNGAAQVVDLGPSSVGVACDGNEKIVLLDVGDLDATPLPDVAALVTGTLCEIAGQTAGRRVRYLAGDGAGGFLVAEGPTPLSLTSGARLWHFDANCEVQGLVNLSGSGQLGEVEAFPADTPTWLVASAGVLDPSQRGVLVVQSLGGTLDVCQTLVGFESHWPSADGQLEPFGLAVNADGSGVAVGAGPFQAPTAGPGYGKVLWGALVGTDNPCTMTASVINLTDGAAAPAVLATDAATFRRAPSVVELIEIHG
ncbi:MAG: hypothetical protein JKY37_16185 [Nannocystaceae bacterium]|nr:hypothetical protein [Nannocystaceae bacterium]